ncbi:MAG: hypothetical protein H6822_07895 [Planctomycetaceae bacterium]|nr:hypothetical protein [Planctomycetales bacterium]MCB9922088.1 hypothetical protein [Planctomycetaceae bacterium]
MPHKRSSENRSSCPVGSPNDRNWRDGRAQEFALAYGFPNRDCLLALSFCVAIGSVTSLIAGDSYEQKLQRLMSMPASEKESLRQKQERFERLSPKEQEKLRQLDTAVTEDARAAELLNVMQSYAEWLRALPSSQRIELLSLPTDERVERVKLLLADQERQRFQELFGSKLQPTDQKVLHDWVQGLFDREKAAILRRLTPFERQRLVHVDENMQRQVVMAMIYRGNPGEASLFELLKPTSEDLQELAAQLSPLARDTLAAARGDKEREQLIQTWSRAAIESRIRPPVTKEEIQQFLEDHVTTEQRAYLESLPRDRMRMELQRLYLQHRFNSIGRPGMRKRPDAK